MATCEPVVDILVDYFWCQSIGLTHFGHTGSELKMNGFPSKFKRLLKEDDRWILSRQKQQLSTLHPITIFFSMPFDATGRTFFPNFVALSVLCQQPHIPLHWPLAQGSKILLNSINVTSCLLPISPPFSSKVTAVR